MQCEKSTTIRGPRAWWPWQLTTRQKKKGDKASAITHLVRSIDLEANHSASLNISTSSVWHDAITRYIKKLPDDDQRSIISTKDDSALTAQSVETLISPLIAKHNNGRVMKMLIKFGPILQHIRSFATIVDVAVQSHPNVACLIWGGVRLILEVNPQLSLTMTPNNNVFTVIQISSRTLELLVEVSELFERLSTHLRLFEQWASLFPRKDYEELSECLTETYLEYIGALVGMIQFLRGSGIGFHFVPTLREKASYNQ